MLVLEEEGMRKKSADRGEAFKQVFRNLDEFFSKIEENRQLTPERSFQVVEISGGGDGAEREADSREKALMRFLEDRVAGRGPARKLKAFKGLTMYFDDNKRGWSLVVCAYEEETLFTLNATDEGRTLTLVLTPTGKSFVERLVSELEQEGLLTEFMEKK
ncbi:MAG: hypothetical protein QXH27_04035 [Candidatus Micrarchaeia archaeon]